MAERKVVIMYKDVWKKFGAKILIVACSILLLGGVAIAAPRLRAVTDALKIELFGTENVLTYVDDNTVVYPKHIMIENIQIDIPDGEVTLSDNKRSINWATAGLTMECQDGCDWTQAGEQSVKISIDSTSSYSKWNADVLGNSGVLKYNIDQKIAQEIKITTNNASTYPSNEIGEGDIAVQSIPHRLVQSNFTVTVDGVATEKYEIVTSKNPDKNESLQGGGNTIWIKLKNYKDKAQGQYVEKAVTIKRHIKDFQVTIGGVKDGQFVNSMSFPGVPDVVVKDGDTTLVQDTDYSVTENSDGASSFYVVVTGLKNSDCSCVGTIVSNSYTHSTASVNFYLAEEGAAATAAQKLVPYDESANTYLINEMTDFKCSLIMKEGSNASEVVFDTASAGALTGGRISWRGDAKFIKDGKEDTGATAGVLRQTITVTKADGITKTGTLEYKVTREIADANGRLNSKLRFKAPIPKPNSGDSQTPEGSVYIYDGNQHIMIPQMYFEPRQGEAERILSPDDYTVEYGLDPMVDNIWAELDDVNARTKACIDRGTVIMKISGKGVYTGTIENDQKNHSDAQYESGWEMLENAKYVIDSQKISEDLGDSVVLLAKSTDTEETKEYLLGTTKDTIIKNSYLKRQDGTKTKINTKNNKMFGCDESKDVVFRYLGTDTTGEGTPVTENVLNMPGTYRVVYKFDGNYETKSGGISCLFTIRAIDGSYSFKVLPCEESENGLCHAENTGITGDTPGKHEYNGEPHKPKVQMFDEDGNAISSNGGKVYFVDHWSYKDGTNSGRGGLTDAGTAIAYVHIAGMKPDEFKEVTFTIEKRTLKQEDFKFLETDGFSKPASGKQTYKYNNTIPELTGLSVKYACGSLSQTADFKVGTDFNVLGLYKGTSNKVTSPDEIEKGEDYNYKIQLTNANYRAGVDGDNDKLELFVGPFVFQARDIGVTVLPENVGAVEYDKNNLNSKVEAFLSTGTNYVITDFTESEETKKTLEYNKDYKIATDDNGDLKIVDRTARDGTVIVTIEGIGSYGNQRNITLNVGVPITRAEVYEAGTKVGQNTHTKHTFTDGKLTLRGTYNYDRGNDYFGIAFDNTNRTNDSVPSTLTYLWDEESAGNKHLAVSESDDYSDGGKYRVGRSSPAGYPQSEGEKSYNALEITGVNGYYGKAIIRFSVERKTMDEVPGSPITVKVDDKNCIYKKTGIPVNLPVIEVYDNGLLVDPSNYDLIFPQDMWTVREAKVQIKGKGSYKGERTVTFHIRPRLLGEQNPFPDSAHNADITSGCAIRGDGIEISLNYTADNAFTYVPGRTGVKPEITVTYTYDRYTGESYVLKESRDYRCEVINNIDVNDSSLPYEKQPMVIIRAIEQSGFAGGFTQTFQITPYNLADETKCEFILRNARKPFTGKLIEDVDPYLTNKDTQTQIPLSELDIRYENNYLVSKEGVAKVVVRGKSTPGKPDNYQNQVSATFTIYGELNLTGDPNFTTNPSDTTILGSVEGSGGVIPYSYLYGSPDLSISTFQVRYAYKPQDAGGTGVQPNPYWNLEWRKDYNIFIGEQNIVDLKPQVDVYKHGHIYGIGCFDGTQETEIVVQGDLSRKGENADTQVSLKGSTELLGDDDPVIITTVNGESRPAKDIADRIEVVCGRRTLIYGEDYVFADSNGNAVAKDVILNELKADLGTIKTAYIIPAKQKDADGNSTDKDVKYLTGACPIKYTVREELTLNEENVTGIEPEYEYKHGQPVIDLNKVEVTIVRDSGTIKLNNRNGCEIKFGETGGSTVGNHEVIIKPIGDYSGAQLSVPFRIIKYDLGKAYESGNLKIAWNKQTTYTGKDVFPIVHSVTAYTVSGTAMEKELFPVGNTAGEEGAYELRSKQGEDNVNFSNDKLVKCILAGDGNYTGEVDLEYRILQKDIADQTDGKYDVKFEVDQPNYDYKNGEDIRPKPTGTYNGITFTGEEDKGGGIGSITGIGIPFIYSYPEDTKNVGKKTIKITGTGNYTGNRTLDYNIIPLNFAKTDLEFAPGEIIYDGTEQHPAFKLSFQGKEILSYDKNSGVVSSYIPKVGVKFQNATNATKEKELAKVIIEFPEGSTDSNYTGRKIGEFAIQQASLQDHVKFKHHPAGEGGIAEINAPLKYDFKGVGKGVTPNFALGVKPTPPEGEDSDPGPFRDTDLQENEVGAFYDYLGKANDGSFLKPGTEGATEGNGDYKIEYKYVEPDSEDTPVKEGYGDKDFSFAGKVKVTITGINNYKDSACFWYFIGKDISEDGSAKLQPTTAVYNAQKQPPKVIVSGISGSQYNIARYKNEVKNENYFANDKGFVDAATYYIRLEGKPTGGTYATKPITLTYTITPRPISNSVVIDGFKKEYNYTGLAICPVGISVTDYIDRTKYKLTENKDYSLTYANNINVGTATITVNGEGNFKGTGAARFAITSSMISSGNNGNPGGSVSNGSGQISGAVAVAPDDVRITLDAGDAMYYTGKQLTPAVTIDKMTQNTDYTVTYSNNIEVGTATVTITGMGNNTGTITKNFRIVAKLSDCKVTNIPDQKYTGSAVTPIVTVTCGNSILTRDKDYTVTYINNVEIGTATVKIRAANNPNYVGELEAKFNIGNNVGGFLVSGFAPTYPYTGNAVTPAVVVESGSTRLQQGTDYTIAYKDNVNAGTASIIVTGAGKYTGTQTVNFIIEPRSLQVCETTQVEDKTYTGDAYTPDIVVKDSGKVLEKGKDYTLTYADNVNPGVATIIIQGLSNNYTGIKKLTFRIGGVAVNGLKVSTVKATSIKLKWEQQGYADGYVVCDSNAKVVKRVKGNSATVTGLKPGKKYKYNVKSYTVNSQGEESYGKPSSVVSATTKLKTPTVTLKTTGKGKLRISWTKSTNADGYQIYYKNTKGAKFRKIKTAKGVNTRICNVRGIKSGKKCYVRVRAYKKSGSTTLKSSMSKTKTKKVK